MHDWLCGYVCCQGKKQVYFEESASSITNKSTNTLEAVS